MSVEGTVRQFTHAAFTAPFGLPDPRPFHLFEGRKALVATKVRSLA